MRALASSLQSYVEQYVSAVLARDSSASVRPVIVGPPDAALSETFASLTSGGTHDWELDVAGRRYVVAVLLVNDRAGPAGSALSRECGWDYAVTVRNSSPLVVMLVSRASWDKRPESLSNTTETIGRLGAAGGRSQDQLEAHMVASAASHLGIPQRHVGDLVRLVRNEARHLDPLARDSTSWEVIEKLLASTPGTPAADVACRAAGLPPIGGGSLTFRDAHDTLELLASFVAEVGLHDAIEQMKGTTAAQNHGVVTELDAMRTALAPRLFSPTIFVNAPSRYYAVSPTPAWYDALTAQVLADILAELNRVTPQDRLAIACSNALAVARPIKGGPFVVESGVELQARSTAATAGLVVAFSRKVDRAAPTPVVALPHNPLHAEDAAPPRHRRPIKYKAEAMDHRPGSIDVLALDSFECGGLVVVRDAERNGIPTPPSRGGTWLQEVTLARGGTTEILVLHSAQVQRVSVARDGDVPVCQNVAAGTHIAQFLLDLENNDVVRVVLEDGNGGAVGSWTVNFTVQDIVDVANSRLEALILQHRTGRTFVPHAPDTLLHRLELGSYLQSPESWKPVVACWSGRLSPRSTIDWQRGANLGDVQPQIDPRRPTNPPASVLASRERVRALLQAEQRCVSEIDISAPALRNAIEGYLAEYAAWLDADPEGAGWLDTIALHATDWNPQAGRSVASEEPVVVLLSALHPIRLAWHAVAQQELASSLGDRCPAAGLVSPSQCPDAGVLYLWDGQTASPRAFFSLPCDHPHWVVLLNVKYLDRPERGAAMGLLAELGLEVQAITGGFTAQQTEDSLEEVNRLLPARATLRVGIVGDAESSSECAEGVFKWSEAQHSEYSASSSGSLQLEVFDTRGAADPSPEELAGLSETTSERVRWFKLKADARIPKLDLTIIDQLGILSHESSTGRTRSVTSAGSLFRLRIREDFQEARAIVESRVAITRLTGPDLPSAVARAVQKYEQFLERDGGRTHFRFTPNQQAVGTRLRDAIFLAVTSSQIDPACIVRGAVGQRGYLWDYELPGILGAGESSLGYYLVAQPTRAMCDAVERAASLVLSPPPNVQGLLEEVSRHGIPILKRLASGGSQSRGELGLLLATRLLQDSFRANAGPARLPVWAGNCIHFVLPVDPYEELFNRLRRSLLGSAAGAQRPDLVVVAIRLPTSSGSVSIKITPVEVKYRASGMAAVDMRNALSQAENLGKLLQALWAQTARNELWKTCSRALLAQFLDFGFRIYAGPWLHGHQPEEWARVHETVLRDVLEGSASTTVNTAGRLLVFGGSAGSRSADLDGDSRRDTAIVSIDDARVVLGGNGAISDDADRAPNVLDFSFPDCGIAPSTQPPSVGNSARGAPAAPQAVGMPTPTSEGGTVEHVSPMGPSDLSSASQQQPPVASQGSDAHAPTLPPTPDADRGQAAQPSPSGARIPAEVRQRVKAAFDGFIGNEPVVTRLSNDLLRALIEQPPHLAKNYLFTGLPSTGKTELARRMALALNLPFVKLDGRGISSRDKLFDLVNGELAGHQLAASQVGQQLGLPVLEYPPLIIFIDEVHLVPKALQESLLTMLEAADRTVVLASHVARVNRTTFLFATTRASDVDAAFASRCDEIQLREYTEGEVAQILRWKVPHDDWPEAIYGTVARLGRCVPRVAIQLAGALETAVMVAEQAKALEEHLEDVRRAREIDTRGLTRMDFEYLGILERAKNPVGEQNILNLMRTVDKDRILNELEPFLVRLGFIRHGPRGRELTNEGREYFLAQRVHGDR